MSYGDIKGFELYVGIPVRYRGGAGVIMDCFETACDVRFGEGKATRIERLPYESLDAGRWGPLKPIQAGQP